jgi:hypothetical protein
MTWAELQVLRFLHSLERLTTDIPQLRSKQYGNLSPQIAARSLHGIIAIDDIRYLPK